MANQTILWLQAEVYFRLSADRMKKETALQNMKAAMSLDLNNLYCKE